MSREDRVIAAMRKQHNIRPEITDEQIKATTAYSIANVKLAFADLRASFRGVFGRTWKS